MKDKLFQIALIVFFFINADGGCFGTSSKNDDDQNDSKSTEKDEEDKENDTPIEDMNIKDIEESTKKLLTDNNDYQEFQNLDEEKKRRAYAILKSTGLSKSDFIKSGNIHENLAKISENVKDIEPSIIYKSLSKLGNNKNIKIGLLSKNLMHKNIKLLYNLGDSNNDKIIEHLNKLPNSFDKDIISDIVNPTAMKDLKTSKPQDKKTREENTKILIDFIETISPEEGIWEKLNQSKKQLNPIHLKKLSHIVSENLKTNVLSKVEFKTFISNNISNKNDADKIIELLNDEGKYKKIKSLNNLRDEFYKI